VKRESNEGGLMPHAFFARLPGGSAVVFRYYLLGATLRRRSGYIMLGFATLF